MAIKNNYWKTELSKQDGHISAGESGWEIHYRNEEGKIVVDFYRGIPIEAKKDFRFKFNKMKRIAQSVTTEREFINLSRRIDPEDWEYILKNDLKDDNLVRWAYNTRTADEYERLLRYN